MHQHKQKETVTQLTNQYDALTIKGKLHTPNKHCDDIK